MAKLIAILSGQMVEQRALDRQPMTFGRDRAASLCLDTPFLSRQHGKIAFEDNHYVLTDLGTTNGTHVNGQPVTRHVLKSGDTIHVGNVILRFQDEEAESLASSRLAGATPPPSKGDAKSVDAVLQTYSLKMTAGAKKPEPGAPAAAAAPADAASSEKASRMFFILFQVGKELSKVTQLDDLFSHALKHIFDVLPAQRGLISMVDRQTGILTPRMAYTKDGGPQPPQGFQVSSSILQRAITEKAAIMASDAMADQRFTGQSIMRQSIRGVLCVPLWDDEEVYGALYIDNTSRTNTFTEDDRALLTGIANLIALRLRQEKLSEQLQHEAHLRDVLSKYNSPDVVDILLKGGDFLEPHRREVSVLFVDLADSTGMAERMDETDVYTLLNYFYDVVTEAVFTRKGHINKYIGDAVLALFNAPTDMPDHARIAVEAAVEVARRFEDHNKRQPDLPLKVRIGINTGNVIAGNVGGQHRMEYTVLGDPVNTCDRIMKVERKSPVALGEATWRKVKDFFPTRDLGEMMLKGKGKALRVYEVLMDEVPAAPPPPPAAPSA